MLINIDLYFEGISIFTKQSNVLPPKSIPQKIKINLLYNDYLLPMHSAFIFIEIFYL